MPANYLHGVETITLDKGPVPINVVKSSVICIVGIAPKGGNPNAPVLVINDATAESFGKKLPGFDIPFAIEKIRKYKAGTIIVVNTFDIDDNGTDESNESHVIADYKAKLTYCPLNDAVIKSNTVNITGASNATPIVITAAAHGFVDGQQVTIASVGGNTNANGTYYVKKLSSSTFELYTNAGLTTGRAGNAAYTSGGTAQTTFIKDVDYSVDEFGNIKVLKATVIGEGATIKCDYTRLDPTTVNSAQIIGANTAGVRTGLKVLDLVYPTFGFTPKVICCPDTNTIVAVRNEMKAMADKWRAMYMLDVVADALPTEVITGRGPSGVANYSTTDKRAIVCYPRIKVQDPDPSAADGDTVLRPYSEEFVGVMAQTDRSEGYWVSPSNHNLLGILEPEQILTWSINDPDSEVNLLNEVGVTTYIKDVEYKSWGNRNASFPNTSGIGTFIPMQRLDDIISESIEAFSRPFVDRPINDAIIDTIVESVNAFFRKLKGDGAVIEGRCFYDPNNNSAENLANGNITFDYEYVGGPPAERITYRSFRNIQFLTQLGA
jgi:uncharacterized protein